MRACTFTHLKGKISVIAETEEEAKDIAELYLWRELKGDIARMAVNSLTVVNRLVIPGIIHVEND